MDDRPTNDASAKENRLPVVVDLLADSFAPILNEAEWLIQLFGPGLARCIDDDFK